MKAKEILKKVLFIEIFEGLWLTLRKIFFARPVTIEYPDKVIPEPFSGFRGRHALVRDPETGDTKCVACLRCARVCPSRCISIEFEKDKNSGKRKVLKYEIDVLRCVFCAYCVEVCPVNAIVLTEFYEYNGSSRKELIFDKEKLLKNWDEFVKNKGQYVNPFWRPKGIPEKFLPPLKRKIKEC